MKILKNISKKFQKHMQYYQIPKKDNSTIRMVMLVLMGSIPIKIFFKVYKEEEVLILMMRGDGVTRAVHCTFLANMTRQSNVMMNQSKLIQIIQLYGTTKVLRCTILESMRNL